MQFFIFLFLIITSINCDIPSLHSAYFRILHEYHFEQANLCLPWVDILIVTNIYGCQIACIKNKLCRTATFYQITNQCNLFSERLEDGQLKPMNSTTVITLIKRHPSNGIANESILTQITSPTDIIQGIWNTSAGQDSSCVQLGQYVSGSSPPDEDVSKAIDNDLLTKHVSFGDGCNTCYSLTAGHNTGFYIIPTQLSILTHLCWATSHEFNETARDPMISKFEIKTNNCFYSIISVTIEGSNETSISNLTHGSSWSLIYNGTSGLDGNPPRSTYKLIALKPLCGTKPTPFKSYRLLVVQKRGLEDSVQYSEALLFGHIID
jgi:hypothetical protein